jgi:hypothetical protein
MSAAWMNFTKVPLIHDEGAMPTGIVHCGTTRAVAGCDPDRRRRSVAGTAQRRRYDARASRSCRRNAGAETGRPAI